MRWSTFWDVLAVLVGGLVGLGIAAAYGCGAPSPGARYGAEVARCIANEREIVRRSCHGLDEDICEARDTAALNAERERCDAALSEIEAEARAAVEAQ